MIIERNLAAYLVYAEDPVLRALEKITANQARIIFLVDSHGHLEGSLSDGDFRRWVATQDPVDLNRPAREAAHTAGPVGADQHHARRDRDACSATASTTSRSSTSAAAWSPSRSTATTRSGSAATRSTATARRW